MAKKYIRPPTRSSARASSSDGDGNHIHNEILLGLPRSEQEKLLPKLEFVRLRTHHVLHEPGDSLKSAYFCNTGLISILSVFPDGKSVEVGLVGKEGFVGLPLVAKGLTRPVAGSTSSVMRSCWRQNAGIRTARSNP